MSANFPIVWQEEEPKPNTLKWFAAKAKKEKKESITIYAPHSQYLGAEISADAAFSDYSVVIARPVRQRTYAPYSDKVVTWHKFKILESLSQRPPCSVCQLFTVEPPSELLPLSDDEFLLVRDGGTVSIDGVKVTMVEPGLPPFSRDKVYLLFISRNPSGDVTLLAGPDGAFTVEAGGKVKPVNGRPHPIKEAIRSRFSNSVNQLRQFLLDV